MPNAVVRATAGAGAPPPEDPPDEPTGLTAGSITETGCTLSWTAPAGGAAVAGYEIEVQEAGGDWSAPVFQGTSATTSKAVTGLDGNVEYDARVRATNAAGESDWLEELELVLTKPAAPAGLSTSSSDTEVQLSWTTEVGVTYKLYRHTSNVFGSATLVASGEAGPSYDFTGLTNGTLYYLWVVANNATGDSAPSGDSETPAAGAVPSYDPPYGSGDRTGSLTISVTGGLTYSGTLSRLLNGSYPDNTFFWLVTGSAGDRLVVQFPEPVLITGFKVRQQNSTTHGDWQAAISDDGSTWVDVGAEFTMGGATVQEVTTMAGNTTPCEFWSVELISGQPSNNPYFYQVEFNVAAVA